MWAEFEGGQSCAAPRRGLVFVVGEGGDMAYQNHGMYCRFFRAWMCRKFWPIGRRVWNGWLRNTSMCILSRLLGRASHMLYW